MTPAELAAIRLRANEIARFTLDDFERSQAYVRALLAEVERLRGADVGCAEYEKETRDLRARIERLW